MIENGWHGYGLPEAIKESEKEVREAATSLYQSIPGSPDFKARQQKYRESQRLLADKQKCQTLLLQEEFDRTGRVSTDLLRNVDSFGLDG